MSKQNGDVISREELTSEATAAQLTAYALGQLQGEELAAFEAKVVSGEVAEQEVLAIRTLSVAASAARASADMPPALPELRSSIDDRLNQSESAIELERKPSPRRAAPRLRIRVVEWIAIGGVAAVLAALLLPASQFSRQTPEPMLASKLDLRLERDFGAAASTIPQSITGESWNERGYAELADGTEKKNAQVADPNNRYLPAAEYHNPANQIGGQSANSAGMYQRMMSRNDKLPPGDLVTSGATSANANQLSSELPLASSLDYSGRFQRAVDENIPRETTARSDQRPKLTEEYGQGEARKAARAQADHRVLDEREAVLKQSASDAEVDTYRLAVRNKELKELTDSQAKVADAASGARQWAKLSASRTKFKAVDLGKEATGTEQYEPILENAFLSPLQQPLSTFSIDVDTASYANMRRFLTSGRVPPPNSVRIEELVNYFRYDYPQPKGGEPFSMNMEVAECPWKEGHLVLRVGLKGKDVHRSERPASNLVFLLDVSGSMADQNKLPLLKTAMKLLVGELGENDRVSIVTYAGEAGLRLAPTRGHEQEKINRVIDSLSAGGSTNGSAGINLAYEQAAAYFVAGGTNRVILCTDGDLNVGVTSDEALVRLIKQKAAGGTFLTVLGFGEGNLKDAKMEKLADNGNGMYAYIDSVREARKVLVEQLTGSTITIAKDVKIQIEFNPAQIASYRLLGYENRVLAAEDFNNDKKDAGEIGAGHTVTALYELVPVGAAEDLQPRQPGVDPLKYQSSDSPALRAPIPRTPSPQPRAPSPAAASGELLTLKLRYKEPEGETSKLLEYPLKDRGHSFHSASPDLQFAAAVASFGMILRGSEHRGDATLDAVAEIASGALGKDAGGYRAEFIDLVRKAKALGAK